MNSQRSFDELFADHMGSAPWADRLPDDFYQQFQARARQTRQRPRWLALVRQDPMRQSSVLVVGAPGVQAAVILVTTLLLSLAVAGAGIAGSHLLGGRATIVVDATGSGDVTTVAEGVAMAQDGDTVIIRPGRYGGSIVIDKDITVRGEDRDSVVIDVGCSLRVEGAPGVATGRGVVVGLAEIAQATDFWYDDCPEDTATFTARTSTSHQLPYGLLVDHVDAEISDLSVVGTDSAIVAVGGAPLVHAVMATGVLAYDDTSMLLRDSEVWRVAAWGRSPATIEDNDIIEHVEVNPAGSDIALGGEPVYAPNQAAAVIRGNRLSGLILAGPVLVEDNEFRHRQAFQADWLKVAVDVEPGTGWIIKANDFSGYDTAVRAAGYWGPTALGGTSGAIEGNTITDAFYGIIGSGAATVTGNTIRHSRAAALRLADATWTLEGNVIEDNAIGLQYRDSILSMTGNRICDNETNVEPLGGATRPNDAGNEICPDDPA